jgi:hypothetical protein
MGSKGTGNPEEMEQFSSIRACLADIRQEDNCLSIRDLAVNGHDLMALGLKGSAIGKTLEQLLCVGVAQKAHQFIQHESHQQDIDIIPHFGHCYAVNDRFKHLPSRFLC